MENIVTLHAILEDLNMLIRNGVTEDGVYLLVDKYEKKLDTALLFAGKTCTIIEGMGGEHAT